MNWLLVCAWKVLGYIHSHFFEKIKEVGDTLLLWDNFESAHGGKKYILRSDTLRAENDIYAGSKSVVCRWQDNKAFLAYCFILSLFSHKNNMKELSNLKRKEY